MQSFSHAALIHAAGPFPRALFARICQAAVDCFACSLLAGRGLSHGTDTSEVLVALELAEERKENVQRLHHTLGVALVHGDVQQS